MSASSPQKPVRAVVIWQGVATVLLAALGGWLAGVHGAVSVALGGAISMVAGVLAAWMAERAGKRSGGEVLYGALRAEAVRIVLMFALLWLALAQYKQVVAIGLLGSFIVTALMFSMGMFARDR